MKNLKIPESTEFETRIGHKVRTSSHQ
jgi:hypothetical protein